MSDFLFLDQEMIHTGISLRVYKDAKMQELPLVRAGVPWKDVDVSVDFITVDERPNKMTRFTLRLRFADASHCIVTLKDNGFGEYCPSSNRIWERYLSL